jgi:iron complex transport system substrate-binding protein
LLALCLGILAALLPMGAESGRASDPLPRRIIANAPSNAEIVCALGHADRLVGVSKYVTYPPELAKLPRVGGLDDPDLERIVALKPDLILQRGHNEQVAALCQRLDARLYRDRTDSLPSLYQTITDVGGLLGCAERAVKLNDSIKARLDRIAEAAPTKRPRVLLVLRSPDRLAPMTTVGESSFLNDLITIAGGDNVFGESALAYPQIGLEEVIVRQPDIILDVHAGETFSEARRAQLIAQWDVLDMVPAVHDKRVHLVTADHLLIPSPRMVDSVELLHRIFIDKVQGDE